MLARLILAVCFATVLQTRFAVAAENGFSSPLPSVEKCSSKARPILPGKWHGTYLMAPFTRGQLVLGDFVFDASINAAGVRLYGLRHGSLDLFMKGRSTYIIKDAGTASASCADIGDTGLRPFSRDWLGRRAQCTGSAPVAGVNADWWKTPSTAAPSANWIWYDKADSSPFRLMFTQPENDPAILGWYTFSYQVKFEPLQATELSSLDTLCRSAQWLEEKRGREALQKLIAAMESSSGRADQAIARLMPEVDVNCKSAALPRWPERARMTALMTSPNFDSAPLPAEILYDGSRKAQRTRMFWPSGSSIRTADALLGDEVGYSIEESRRHRLSCTADLPGALRPNWPETGGCSCEAVIKANTPLNPSGPAKIMVCPMTKPRVVWSWFSLDGQPLVFMETSAPGDKPSGVLTLVDYYSFAAGQAASPEALRAPNQCRTQQAGGHAAVPVNGSPLSPRRCGACHTDKAPLD
ncbi:MAG: hypothetical protein WBX25_27105 [Rhodomicrobium sp.]